MRGTMPVVSLSRYCAFLGGNTEKVQHQEAAVASKTPANETKKSPTEADPAVNPSIFSHEPVADSAGSDEAVPAPAPVPVPAPAPATDASDLPAPPQPPAPVPAGEESTEAVAAPPALSEKAPEVPPTPPAAPSQTTAAATTTTSSPTSNATPVVLTRPATQAMAADSETCFVCGDTMLPSAEVSAFLKGEVEQPGSRRLQCDSGHAFCVDCWAGSVTVQVKDNGLGCLPCPGYKCGELLDVAWAPVLLKSKELTAHMMTRRKQLVVDCCPQLKACPVNNCGIVVCLPVSALQTAASQAQQAALSRPQIPTCVLCKDGHIFCLECSQTAHSPCTCTQMTQWQALVQEEVKTADIKAKNGDLGNVEGAELANGKYTNVVPLLSGVNGYF
jgi:hypothetical protein